jgi:transposase
VDTGPQRGPRGYDGRKKVKGRKRVLLVDTQGDPLGARVVPAGAQDRDALESLAPDLAVHGSLLLVWLDRGFAGEGRVLSSSVTASPTAEIAGTSGGNGFQVEPRRWKVEPTFGCLQRYRRLRVDDEASLATARAMTLLASVFMTGMRLERMFQT